MAHVSVLPFILFVLAFSPSLGLPQGMTLEELCARCNGTLEIRDGDVAHCIVSTDTDMEAAQRASAEAFEEGLTMVPELKVESGVLDRDEETEGEQEEQEIVVPLNERTFIDGKELEMEPVRDHLNEVDSVDLISAGDLDSAIFYDVSTPKNMLTQEENTL
ncbi:uncharacterized protein LOC106669668 [Cimex lectularius]|uniref:Uncharacterized protein n=1 Tax=Cimex lectularius TaxID=79782 RepID=A0A8I6S2Y0_CIMLE|nr:uncharacterized protein LOC106669668 [Cimex lectularius]